MSVHITKVHHIAIICSDYGKSLDFYTRILGFTKLAEHYRQERESYKADLAIGNEYVIELFSFPDPPERVTNPEAAGLRHLAFETPGIDAAIAELGDLGVECEPLRTDEYTGRRFFFFKDPDGLPLEMYEAQP